MRPVLVAVLAIVGSSACMVYEAPRYRPPPPVVEAPPPISQPRLLSQREAIDAAFREARGRGLDVDRVKHASLDGAGRWHVELRGRADRAKLLLDGRDGRLLKGKFRQADEPEPAPAPAPEDAS